jgi:type VI secretion system secreted protein VgrG
MYRSGPAADTGDPYQGIYEMQPSERPFRAPLRTPKPRVLGPQTARVVGKDGEEIDVDEQGRILVQFHWDRKNDRSCRVRVAQTWSGSKWGTIMIPRIGQEVVVEYLEGDPDRPLVTGTVYNGDKEVPYALPAEKTKAGLKSNSTKGGGGYNELVFDDEKDKEKIGLHAQKDLEVRVLNSETRTIGEKFKSGVSRLTTLEKGDDELKVKSGSQKVDIGSDQTTKVAKKVVIEAGTSLELVCGQSKIKITPTEISIEAAATVKVKASAQAEINGGAMLKQSAGIIKLN